MVDYMVILFYMFRILVVGSIILGLSFTFVKFAPKKIQKLIGLL